MANDFRPQLRLFTVSWVQPNFFKPRPLQAFPDLSLQEAAHILTQAADGAYRAGWSLGEVEKIMGAAWGDYQQRFEED